MSELTVIVPTRGRPAAAIDLVYSMHETCKAATSVIFGLDQDDPERDNYISKLAGFRSIGVRVDYKISNGGNMVGVLNELALDLALHAPPFAVGFMGDDHRPRTVGWDAAYLHSLENMGTGIVYGNDLIQGAMLPTQVALTSDIVRELDYMVPPDLKHMYADNFWYDLGHNAGCIEYLPEVIVEHMHPVAGKAEWDPNYERVNALMVEDSMAYQRYRDSGDWRADLKAVQELVRRA